MVLPSRMLGNYKGIIALYDGLWCRSPHLQHLGKRRPEEYLGRADLPRRVAQTEVAADLGDELSEGACAGDEAAVPAEELRVGHAQRVALPAVVCGVRRVTTACR